MTRSTMSAGNRAEVGKAAIRLAEFIELRFPSGTVRSTTADRNVVWGGFTWLADARYVKAAGMAEKADLKARRTSIVLAGTDAALVNKIMTDKINFAEADLYVGVFDKNWVLVADPHPLAKNLLMSAPRLRLEEGKAEIEISAESWTLLAGRDSVVLATPQTQRLRYPGDTGQDKVAAIMTSEIEWGGVFTRGSAAGSPDSLSSTPPEYHRSL